MNDLSKYDAACKALAEAVTADEVMSVRLEFKALEAVARVAKNIEFEAKAIKYRLRAEAKLGEMLIEAERLGMLARPGGQPAADNGGSVSEPPLRATLKDIGIDKKLSTGSKKLASISERAREAMFAQFERESVGRRRPAMDVIHSALAARNAGSRRNLARELSDASVPLSPNGRRFPCIYADPPWKRKAGIGNRAYENQYPTMSWDDICAMPVAQRALPDAWLFLWMPRAHLLATTMMNVELGDGASVDVHAPLAWRVAHAWGFPTYSTCFVWTKTDEEIPDDHGLGLIAWDQDELLLLFKRGRGLPKPETSDKFGSNHRERPGEHSAKPEFYRRMIQAMTGGLPVLELFARVDAEHPLPPNWEAWGNQAHPVIRKEQFDPQTGEIKDDEAA